VKIKIIDPIALMVGLIPDRIIPYIFTGSVSSNPQTNQAMITSSKEIVNVRRKPQ